MEVNFNVAVGQTAAAILPMPVNAGLGNVTCAYGVPADGIDVFVTGPVPARLASPIKGLRLFGIGSGGGGDGAAGASSPPAAAGAGDGGGSRGRTYFDFPLSRESLNFLSGLALSAKLDAVVLLLDSIENAYNQFIREFETFLGDVRENREPSKKYRALRPKWRKIGDGMGELCQKLLQGGFPREQARTMEAIVSSIRQVAVMIFFQLDLLDRHAASQKGIEMGGVVMEAVKTHERIVADGCGYRVSPIRKELAEVLIDELAYGAVVKWEHHRLVIQTSVERPVQRNTALATEYVAWPPSPDDLVLRVYLAALGWNMDVEAGGDGVTVRIDFGESVVERL